MSDVFGVDRFGIAASVEEAHRLSPLRREVMSCRTRYSVMLSSAATWRRPAPSEIRRATGSLPGLTSGPVWAPDDWVIKAIDPATPTQLGRVDPCRDPDG
jgi:hypothetical protein